MQTLSRTERMRRILELLETRAALQVSELANEFVVSEVTVRQDLSELARNGLVARVRGGVRPLERGQSEAAFDVRLRLQELEKRAIAKAAAALVGDGEAIGLDSSTTAYYLALELRSKREIVVVTNGLRAAAALAGSPGVNVLVTGGLLRLPAMSLVGDVAAVALRTTRIDKGFFGARGVSVERGCMDLNPEEVRLKSEMAAACERVIGIFDRTKWERSALLSFVPAARVDVIVTDAGAPADAVDTWRKRGAHVVVAEDEGTASTSEPPPSLLPTAASGGWGAAS